MSKDVDANGQPIPMNARERDRTLIENSGPTKNLTRSPIIKACRLNPKTKLLCESGNFKTANEYLVRIRQRFHSVDETLKASHLLRYAILKQLEGESGADFVDREQKEYTALREMGINVDDSLRLTKFIQQDTTNSKHESLTQTIFTTPNMTLSTATVLFRLTIWGHPPLLLQHLLSTQSFAGTARRKAITSSPAAKNEKSEGENQTPTRIHHPLLVPPKRSSITLVLFVMLLIIFSTSVLARKKPSSV
jgi:hypothetical protein